MSKVAFPIELNATSFAIILLPVLSTRSEYRDVLSGSSQPRIGVEKMATGAWLVLPELVVPRGLERAASILGFFNKRICEYSLPFENRGFC